MIRINDNYLALAPSYLFSDIARRVEEFRSSHPEAPIIRMGIGDVTRPICRAAIEAMHRAVDDEASTATFHGYGPEQGYDFLRSMIATHDYAPLGVTLDIDEIFISDGAKSDTGNIGDILAPDCSVAVTDPVYPVYVDSNIMSGRTDIRMLPCTEANGFVPELPQGTPPDMIYLCYPNNPTGTTLTRAELRRWVDYALANGVLLLFDAAYEAYVTSPDVPRSIYEIEGAKECAIEFRSYSKTAGFTGLRCGYTVVPHALKARTATGATAELNRLWNRRQTTKFNGASYIVQRAAEALYSPDGRRQTAETIEYYRQNARTLRAGLTHAGLTVYGGIDSPYLWVRTPDGLSSWQFFDLLLDKYNIVGTPGSGFGNAGEGFLRLTAFNTHEATSKAIARILNIQ